MGLSQTTTSTLPLETLSFPVEAANLEAQVPTATQEQQDAIASSKQRRSDGAYLDGLRGIAALGVFNHHLLGDGQSPTANAAVAAKGFWGMVLAAWTRLSYKGGTPAVCFFFILTGYVLSLSSLNALAKGRRKQCRGKLLAGAMRRPLRLYMPVLTVALVAALMMQLPFNIFPDALWHKRRDNIFLELGAFLRITWEFFQPIRTTTVADHYAYNPVLWTIPISLKGSLIVYSILMLLTAVPLSKPYITGALSTVAMLLLHKAYWWEACFIIGIAIAVLRSNIGGTPSPAVKSQSLAVTVPSYIAVAAGLYLLSAPSLNGHPELSANTPGWGWLTTHVPSSYSVNNYWRFWHSYGALTLILGLQNTTLIQRFLTTRPVQYLGHLSFMFYAVHFPIFLCIGDRWRRVLGRIPYMSEGRWYDNLLRVPAWGPEALTLRTFVIYTTILAMVLVVADWATKWIDEPCGRLCKKVGENLEKRGSQ